MPEQSPSVAIFGDLEIGVWGLLRSGEEARLMLAAVDREAGAADSQSANVDREDDDIWTVSAGGSSLRLEKAAATTATPDGHRGLEPIRVTGTLRLGSAEHEVDIAGVLADGSLATGDESMRLLATWFPAGHQVALRATRPRGAKGHDKDLLEVVALGEQQPLVFDPRLSTTYGASGAPRTAGIELWLGTDEEGEQHPRRVSGVATGETLEDAHAGVQLSAFLMSCRSRAETGLGVYLLLGAAT